MPIPSVVAKTLASFVATGALVVGFGSGAYADTTQAASTPTAAASQKGCLHVDKKLDRLAKGRHAVEVHLDHEQKALAAARAQHRDDRAARIEVRIDRTKKHRDKIVDRIAKLSARCSVTPAPASAPAAPALPAAPAVPAT